MASFPTDLPTTLISFKSKNLKPSNKQTSSAGYTMAFPKGTILKKVFNFKLSYLSNTDKETLETFFDANQGLTFQIDFTCTGDTTEYDVVFDIDELEFVYERRFPAYYTIDIKVKEV